ncbi:hypothetical protein [Microbacterium foliorum]|nr:hypothetical protein [Microbacterium foliorum]
MTNNEEFEKYNNQESEKDYAPFPDPFPEDSGFGPLTSDNRKEWWKDKRKWEAVHGSPDEKPEGI